MVYKSIVCATEADNTRLFSTGQDSNIYMKCMLLLPFTFNIT